MRDPTNSKSGPVALAKAAASAIGALMWIQRARNPASLGPMAEAKKRDLELKFHGRIVDHLAVQTYQSPIAAIAEMVANGWDADAATVDVLLPADLDEGAELVIVDDGIGMTFDDVQQRYLEVGYNRRGAEPGKTTGEGRPLMGRKGIGKFAGFGIADRMTIDTVSKSTGERTRFSLDFERLRGDSDDYVDESPTDIPDVEWWEDGHDQPAGTRIELGRLKLKKRPAADQTRQSLARRFLLLERAAEFGINVDGEPIADEGEGSGVQFRYPEEWSEVGRPTGLSVEDDGWGVETVQGHEIRWQCVFYNDTIKEEELRGFAVFAHNKLAQVPFFFDFTGGTEGQQGQEYLSGKVEASFLDDGDDLISIERQRVDWNNEGAAPLLTWGQERLKQLLSLWSERRVEDKMKLLNEKVAPFSERLGNLPTHERRIVEGAIKKLAAVKALTNAQFVTLSEATLTAWEGGRLKELINDMADAGEMDEGALLSILVEHQALTALHTAEAVKVKKQVVDGLRERIEAQDLENAVRNYIAENPWLIDPKWETYRVEKALKTVIEEAAKKRFSPAMLDKRLDLVLSSGEHVLVLEFQKPGNKIDGDHLSRFELYVNTIRANVEANTAGEHNRVTGYIVADKIEADAAVVKKIQDMSVHGMFAMDWKTLLDKASHHWAEFFEAVVERSPDDPRVQRLRADEAEANDDAGAQAA
jgi:signal transduction histidine kinase